MSTSGANPGIPRDPAADVRTRRALERIAGIMNALIRSGQIVQTDDGDYTIVQNFGSARPAFAPPPDNEFDETRIIPGPPGAVGAAGPRGEPGLATVASFGPEPEERVFDPRGPGPVVLSGRILGYDSVSTAETTTSATPADLATVQDFSFYLEAAADVLVGAFCTYSNTTVGAIGALTADLDGSDSTISLTSVPGAGGIVLGNFLPLAAVAAGSHTLTLQFSVNAGTGTFQSRTIVAWRLN